MEIGELERNAFDVGLALLSFERVANNLTSFSVFFFPIPYCSTNPTRRDKVRRVSIGVIANLAAESQCFLARHELATFRGLIDGVFRGKEDAMRVPSDASTRYEVVLSSYAYTAKG